MAFFAWWHARQRSWHFASSRSRVSTRRIQSAAISISFDAGSMWSTSSRSVPPHFTHRPPAASIQAALRSAATRLLYSRLWWLAHLPFAHTGRSHPPTMHVPSATETGRKAPCIGMPFRSRW